MDGGTKKENGRRNENENGRTTKIIGGRNE